MTEQEIIEKLKICRNSIQTVEKVRADSLQILNKEILDLQSACQHKNITLLTGAYQNAFWKCRICDAIIPLKDIP